MACTRQSRLSRLVLAHKPRQMCLQVKPTLDVFATRAGGDMRSNPFADARIETPRLVLRPFERRDVDAFCEIAGQEEVLKFLPSTDRMSRDELEGVFGWVVNCYETNTVAKISKFTLAVILRQAGELVGWCGLGPLEYDESEIELYFVISHERWGIGLATEAAQALLEYAFDTLGLRRVVAVAAPENRASVRVLQKIGMTRQGVVRGVSAAYRDYEGHACYSITREREA
jgi:ribosomal-protein-alanine N-acetyltransferase